MNQKVRHLTDGILHETSQQHSLSDPTARVGDVVGTLSALRGYHEFVLPAATPEHVWHIITFGAHARPWVAGGHDAVWRVTPIPGIPDAYYCDSIPRPGATTNALNISAEGAYTFFTHGVVQATTAFGSWATRGWHAAVGRKAPWVYAPIRLWGESVLRFVNARSCHILHLSLDKVLGKSMPRLLDNVVASTRRAFLNEQLPASPKMRTEKVALGYVAHRIRRWMPNGAPDNLDAESRVMQEASVADVRGVLDVESQVEAQVVNTLAAKSFRTTQVRAGIQRAVFDGGYADETGASIAQGRGVSRPRISQVRRVLERKAREYEILP